MELILLKIGLWLTAFYEVVFKLFPNVIVVAMNTRVAKASIGMWFATAIGCSAIYGGFIKKCHNIWILLFILFIPINIHLSPQYSLFINNVEASNFWVWKPFVTILAYFLMFLAIQSMRITRVALSRIFNIMVWCGFLMSIYAILQYFGWDQFYMTKEGHQFAGVSNKMVGGTLGQPTIVAPFIAMLVPLSLYLKKIDCTIREIQFFHIPTWLTTPTLIAAVVITRSDVALGGMLVCLIVYSLLRWRLRGFLGAFIVGIMCFGAISSYAVYHPQKVKHAINVMKIDNGRFKLWKKSLEILKTKKLGTRDFFVYPFTGAGLGSYSTIISEIITPPEQNRHKDAYRTKYAEAHNDYVQTLCWGGKAGLFLFLASIVAMLKMVIIAFKQGLNRLELSALVSSFICIMVIAGATFVLQLSPHNFYAVLLVGLLHNQSLIKGELA